MVHRNRAASADHHPHEIRFLTARRHAVDNRHRPFIRLELRFQNQRSFPVTAGKMMHFPDRTQFPPAMFRHHRAAPQNRPESRTEANRASRSSRHVRPRPPFGNHQSRHNLRFFATSNGISIRAFPWFARRCNHVRCLPRPGLRLLRSDRRSYLGGNSRFSTTRREWSRN